MNQKSDHPTSDSVNQLLDSLDVDISKIQHIRDYIHQLENRIQQLEDILADVNPDIDILSSLPVESTKPADTDDKQLILIVEDDIAINHMVKSIVESEGYASITAETGQDGLDLAGRYTPHLIICDIHLPGMHGLEVIRHFKAIPRLEHVPIIMLTADLFKAEASFELGADEYLMKPIRKKQLMGYITKYLATV